MVLLRLLTAGESAEVAKTGIDEGFSIGSCCQGARPECLSRVEAMGLRAGKMVEILNNHRAQGVLLVKVDGSRIALNRSMAMKIMVRRMDGCTVYIQVFLSRLVASMTSMMTSGFSRTR
jgi:Fe2+ transport system protein FeoA